MWHRYVAELFGVALPPSQFETVEKRRFDLAAVLADELNNALVRDLDLAGALVRDLEMIILGSEMIQTSESVRNLAPYTLILTLDRSLGNANLLCLRLLYTIKDHTPAHDRALEIALEISRNLMRIRESTAEREMAAMVGSVIKRSIDIVLILAAHATNPVDLSALDLSGRDLRKLPVADIKLADALWTEATLWPDVLAVEVRRRSSEVWPGLFRVTEDVF
jgi:hypothetical protein